jgi:hypothetical protein
MKAKITMTTFLLFFTFSIFTACDADDESSMPSVDGLLDVQWTATDETGSASITLNSDNTWNSINNVTQETFSGEWSWVDRANLIMKFREFVFFEDSFSEFYRFSNVTDTSVDVEFTTSPNPIQPTNESNFTEVGTWFK